MPPTATDLLAQPSVRSLFALLDGAYHCALLSGHALADFAVAKAQLRCLGLEGTQLKSLLALGYIERRSRPSHTGKKGRSTETVYVLTPAGELLARERLFALPLVPRAMDSNGQRLADKPCWNANRELWYRGELLRRFRRWAPSQIPVLGAFQRQGWQERIDNPLSSCGIATAALQLRKALESLNRQQHPRRLRFVIEPEGRGLNWHPLS